MAINKLSSCVLSLLLLSTTTAYADTYHCEGYDGSSNKVSMDYNEAEEIVTINGQTLKVELTSSNKANIATINYIHRGDPDSYFTLQIQNKKNIILRQINSIDDSHIATVPLDCT
jgi:hypothetical protein